MDYAKITEIIEGLIIIVLAAVILADGVPGLPEVAGEPLLSLPHFKLGVAVISLVLAASLLEESRK